MTAWKQTLTLLLLKCKKNNLKNKSFSIKWSSSCSAFIEKKNIYKNLLYLDWLLLRKECLYSELFWSTFSCIRTEYREIECGKMRTRITLNTDISYAVTARKLPLPFWLKLTCTSKSPKGLPLKVVNCENTFVFVKDTLKAYSWSRNTLFYTTALSRLLYQFEIYTCVFLIDVINEYFLAQLRKKKLIKGFS